MYAKEYFAITLSILAIAFMLHRLWKHLQKRKERELYSAELPRSWVAILEQDVGLYRFLPAELKNKLHGHINYFMHSKTFSGCDGLELTERMKVIIAANACILVLNREETIYPGFETILVYPNTYMAQGASNHDLIESQAVSVRAGESWHRGPIVLSWNHVKAGSLDTRDGHNVVMHEFAHKLDEESSATNGMPVLHSKQQYHDWVKVLTDQYNRFLTRVDNNKNKIIDDYGSVSPPEFFAVATESFFEKSRAMKEDLPALYEQLQNYYRLDPAQWR